jgi:hypothetical protein
LSVDHRDFFSSVLKGSGKLYLHAQEGQTWLTNNAWYRNSTPWLESGEM